MFVPVAVRSGVGLPKQIAVSEATGAKGNAFIVKTEVSGMLLHPVIESVSTT